MARLDAKWDNFSRRGFAWDHFWTDTEAAGAPPVDVIGDLHVVCGFECGINDDLSGSGLYGLMHWAVVVGAPAIDTGVFLHGSQSMRFTAAATNPYLRHNDLNGQGASVVYNRFYFRVSNATPSSDVMLTQIVSGAGNNFKTYLRTTGTVELGFATLQNMGTIVADRWYGIEYQVDLSTSTHRTKWRSWDESTDTWTDRTDATESSSPTTVGATGFDIGIRTGPTSGINVYIDSLLLGWGTTVDAIWSDSTPRHTKVLRLLPTSDGTHQFPSSGDFKYNNSGNIAPSATDVYSYVDDATQIGTADYIAQAVAGSDKFIILNFADTAEEVVSVGVTSTHHSAAAAVNEHVLKVSADGGSTWVTLIPPGATPDDIADTVQTTRHVAMTYNPADGGAWTTALANAMQAAWGGSTDVDPVPFLDSISLEIETTIAGAAEEAPFPYIGGGYYPT